MKLYKHNLSHKKAVTLDMGELIPIQCQDVLPGDIFLNSINVLLRTTPQTSPLIHTTNVSIAHFFVPLRQIWDDADDFHTGGEDGTSTPTHPYFVASGITEGHLFDYIGIPPGTFAGNTNFNALYHRAYAHIYNEYYRDQDLVTKLTIDTTSGQDTTTSTAVQNVAWEKNEHTAARPWEQRGTEVTVSLTGDAPVGYAASDAVEALCAKSASAWHKFDTSGSLLLRGSAETSGDDDYRLYADLSAVTGIGVSDLRQSIGLQKFMERMGKTGARYQEYLNGLGIRGDDLRLMSPLYLGGGKNVIQFSEVVATGSESGSTSVGDLAGHGIAAVRGNRYLKRFKEHGIVMSLLYVRPKYMATQAVDQKFFRTTKEDYYIPELARIGDRIIKNKEVYIEHSTPEGTHGYAPRYNEYRYNLDTIHGAYHSDYNDRHFGRIHSADTALNQSFIECNPTKRVFAEQTKDSIQATVYNTLLTKRMVVPTGEPGFRGL